VSAYQDPTDGHHEHNDEVSILKVFLDCEEGFKTSGPGESGAAGPRRAEIAALRESGLTYAEIGRRFGISRERVRQLATVRETTKRRDLMSRPTLTPTEVARLLGVHAGTVRKWANRGLLRSFRVGPRRDRRFLREDIVAYLSGEESQQDDEADRQS